MTIDRNELDRYITGNYGEDGVPEDDEDAPDPLPRDPDEWDTGYEPEPCDDRAMEGPLR
ncbi:MAG: hypothetical protein K0S99_565 [Thermomicrobiales bacterium]|jgi:hypothetical protein|nr:hypothetical protein [Thermomicrobiales bacterium]